MRVRSQVAAAAAGAWLAACAPAPQSSPTWIACKQAPEPARKAAACAQLIREGGPAADLATAYRLRGEALRGQHEPAAALPNFNAALGLAPNDAAAYAGRGEAEMDLALEDRAAADFATALHLDPSNAEAHQDLGELARLRGDLPTAFRQEDRAIELKPDWARPWLERGLAFLAERRFDMALADFAEAIRLKDDVPLALEASARALTGKGDAKGAATAYGQANGVLLERGEFKRALADADQALALAPTDPEALNGACWTRAIANVELTTAAQDCQKSLVIHAAAADVLDSLAFVEYRQGRLQAAIRDYTAALAVDPKQASSLYMRGVAKLRAGDPGGQADIDAAQSADATVAATFASYGVTAPANNAN